MNKYFKFVIAAAMIAFGVFQMFHRNIMWGILVVIFSGIPVLLFFKNEFILATFFYLRKQNTAKAAKWLDYITNFKTQLYKKQYGYYHYLIGLTTAQDKPTELKAYMEKALEYGLNMKTDRALATLNLGAVALQQGRRQQARVLIEEAKRLDKSSLLTEQIKMLKDQLKLPNMQKHMQNPNMRNRGKFF